MSQTELEPNNSKEALEAQALSTASVPAPSVVPASSPPSLRRQMLVAGGIALTVGAGFAWWRRQGSDAPTPAPRADEFRQLVLPGPDGQPVSVSQLSGRPLLINFWATWCPPCVRELPMLDEFAQSQAETGWQVLGMAIDRVDPVKAFLAKQPVRFPVLVAGFEGLSWVRAWGNSGGALPFTVALSAKNELLHSKFGELQRKDLQDWQPR